MIRIKEDDIKILFIVDWWDGPLSGMCLWQDEKYWFSATDEWYEVYDGENKHEYFRKFEIYEMTPEQIATEEKWHQLFIEKVGDSYKYVDGNRWVSEELKPQGQWHEFYDKYKEYERPKYKEAIAYFDME